MAGLAWRAAAAVLLMVAAIPPLARGTPGQAAPSPAIPAGLLSEARPIGTGPRFQPPATGPVIGRCERSLGSRVGVHVEVFASNRVVILPGGIGTRPSRAASGRLTHARCYGALVTLDPTGLVLVRPGTPLTLASLFRAWGQPLSPTTLASFRTAGSARVTVYVDGRRWHGAPGAAPLAPHAEIVAEIGPHVPPHASYAFPPGS